LNGVSVSSISVFLDETQSLEPHRLASGTISYTQGQTLNGEGFLLDEKQADLLIKAHTANTDVVKPYLNAELFNSILPHVPHRWAIDFGVMEKDVARRYTEPFAIVTDKVKPHRDTLTKQVHEARYWLYWDKREKFIASIGGKDRVLVSPIVTKHLSFMFFPPTWVFSHRLKVFDIQDSALFSVLQSSFHEWWARQFSSTLEQRLNYSTSDAFDTFPFPCSTSLLRDTGSAYHEYRESLLATAQYGLTDCYNCFHDPGDSSAEIQKLRKLHVEMDQAVAAAYGWTDLDLGHGFHKTKQGIRFTISEPARREVLQRLLRLNHERYAEEVKQGLHSKKKEATKRAGRQKKAKNSGPTLFGDDDDEPGAAGEKASQVATKEAKAKARHTTVEASPRPIAFEEIDTDEIMAAFRQATRGRGWLEREELLKEVSLVLGYQRLGPKIEESLRGQLRAAIRRRIIEADGANTVRAGTATMADYNLEELRDAFRSVMRKGTDYERDDVIHSLDRHLGFARVTDTSRDAIKSAINSGIRQGILGYEGSVIWREE
jgi:hypothetical protein